ncbi:MAG: alpha/beta hydrolase family protein [Maribacter sp.]
MKIQLPVFLFLLSVTFSQAQKKPITHDDYDLWKSISSVKISDSGGLIVTEVNLTTKRGDGHLEIHHTKTGQTYNFSRGYNATISADENYVVFKRKPEYEAIRSERRKEVKKDDLSKDALFIYEVKNNTIYDSILNVKSYKMPKKIEGWVVIENFKEKKKKKKKNEKDSLIEAKKDTIKKQVNLAFKQNYALVYQFKSKKMDTIHQIKSFAIPEKGNSFLYALKREKKKQKDLGVYRYDVTKGQKVMIDSSKYLYENLTVDYTGSQFAYMATPDSTAVDSLKYELFFLKDDNLKSLVDSSGINLQKGWKLGKGKPPYFSENGKRLYFGSKPEIHFEKDTTLLEDEIAQVDVWTWKDKLLQPEQKSKAEDLSKKAYLSYYNTETENFVQLQDETIDNLIFDKKITQKYILGSSSQPYDIARSWSFPWRRDYFIINSMTGERKTAMKEAGSTPILSPDGKFAIYFDMDKQDWYSLNLENGEKLNHTEELSVVFYDEDDDHPSLPYPYGFGGFDSDGNALVYDKFDIWCLKLGNNKKPKNVTNTGREQNIQYRLLNLDPEHKDLATYLDNDLMITSFDKRTKASGLYILKKEKLIKKLEPSEYLLRRYQKAKKADIFTYSKENFYKYPDLELTKNGFDKSEQITNLNPHEKEFKWGTVEQFTWTAFDGTKLDGLIYKPEDFDPTKKYPLITYFYEKRADSYRRHATPSPSRSIVNPTYLASNGYVMFVPDIVYKDGQPGQSAYNCVISGVEALEALGYIDSQKMALQGQSWGGYQAAYLITKTNKFKAAMAGAPVSNMTSAYGGIRWKSGLSRAFQYERTQTRIGKNLWEGLDLYIENSPLFSIPSIETPLLMMHNDEDGAVPYYQGIEMFMGMRRLQKPAWLLVYNKEEHNLTKIKNRQDLSIRMMQFFDHYLKDAPAPIWMTKGIPRINKGKDMGYQFDE